MYIKAKNTLAYWAKIVKSSIGFVSVESDSCGNVNFEEHSLRHLFIMGLI